MSEEEKKCEHKNTNQIAEHPHDVYCEDCGETWDCHSAPQPEGICLICEEADECSKSMEECHERQFKHLNKPRTITTVKKELKKKDPQPEVEKERSCDNCFFREREYYDDYSAGDLVTCGNADVDDMGDCIGTNFQYWEEIHYYEDMTMTQQSIRRGYEFISNLAKTSRAVSPAEEDQVEAKCEHEHRPLNPYCEKCGEYIFGRKSMNLTLTPSQVKQLKGLVEELLAEYTLDVLMPLEEKEDFRKDYRDKLNKILTEE